VGQQGFRKALPVLTAYRKSQAWWRTHVNNVVLKKADDDGGDLIDWEKEEESVGRVRGPSGQRLQSQKAISSSGEQAVKFLLHS